MNQITEPEILKMLHPGWTDFKISTLWLVLNSVHLFEDMKITSALSLPKTRISNNAKFKNHFLEGTFHS